MSGWWLVVAFLAGALVWHKVGYWLLHRTFKRGDTLTTEILEGLPQKSLVKVYEKTLAEIERRKKGLAT